MSALPPRADEVVSPPAAVFVQAPTAQVPAAQSPTAQAPPHQSSTFPAAPTGQNLAAEASALEDFLDKLMRAESGGALNARNPRSTAVGPFQFIESTFQDLVARHFASETEKLAPPAVLALRTDLAFSRRAAAIYTRENAGLLIGNGFEASFRNLRLAFLVGAGGAVRILEAQAGEKVSNLLGAAVVRANPFMARMTAADLLERCAREADGREAIAGLPADGQGSRQQRPKIKVKCNLALASCRRWLALSTARLQSKPVSGKEKVRTKRDRQALLVAP
ncbi:MAG: hypothetical protein WC807_04150 [Hyphomicrobium sp.]